MPYVVSELATPVKLTAVIAADTSWEAFPRLWPELLAEVWSVVRAHAAITPNRNVMLYKDNLPAVEVGVEVAAPFAAVDRVICGRLPGGRVATTTHRGRYEDLGLAHAAVLARCDRRGLERSGPCWEICGHWDESSADQEVEIYHLLT